MFLFCFYSFRKIWHHCKVFVCVFYLVGMSLCCLPNKNSFVNITIVKGMCFLWSKGWKEKYCNCHVETYMLVIATFSVHTLIHWHLNVLLQLWYQPILCPTTYNSFKVQHLFIVYKEWWLLYTESFWTGCDQANNPTKHLTGLLYYCAHWQEKLITAQ